MDVISNNVNVIPRNRKTLGIFIGGIHIADTKILDSDIVAGNVEGPARLILAVENGSPFVDGAKDDAIACGSAAADGDHFISGIGIHAVMYQDGISCPNSICGPLNRSEWCGLISRVGIIPADGHIVGCSSGCGGNQDKRKQYG